MHAQSISSWLKRKCRTRAAFDFVAGGLLVACCAAVLAITWGFGYLASLVVQLFLNAMVAELWRADFPHMRFIDQVIASFFLLIVFFVHIRNERELRGEYLDTEFVAGRDSFLPWVVRMSVDTAGEYFGKIASDVVLIGPRLSFYTVSVFRRASRLCSLDYWRCAQILEALLRRGKRMSFTELEELVPDANRFHVFDQLRDIDGVVFLLSEPAGVSLVQDLRAELRGLPIPAKFSPPPESPPPPPPKPQPKAEFRPPKQPPAVPLPKELADCFYVLGISTHASLEQVRTAYRKKMKECHPDRFTRLGKDWQKLAEDRAKQINLAYEMIMSRRK